MPHKLKLAITFLNPEIGNEKYIYDACDLYYIFLFPLSCI